MKTSNAEELLTFGECGAAFRNRPSGYSDRMPLESYNRKESRREHSIISEPAIQVDPANARLAAHSVSG